MLFHRANPSHLHAINAMKSACLRKMLSQGIDQWDDTYPSPDLFRRDCDENNLFVLLNEDQQLLGCAVLDQHQVPEYATVDWSFKAQPIGIIHRLMIAPEHQGRGHAKVLVQSIENQAKQRRYHSIRLDAFLQNPSALRLYAALNYRQSGQVQFRKGLFACFEKQLA